MKRFEITQNRSLDAMDDIVNRRKMTEFGNMALVEDRDASDAAVTLRLPGVRRGDMASRSFKPEVRVNALRFSPTGLFEEKRLVVFSLYFIENVCQVDLSLRPPLRVCWFTRWIPTWFLSRLICHRT